MASPSSAPGNTGHPNPTETNSSEADLNVNSQDGPPEPPFPTFEHLATGELAPPRLSFVAVKEFQKYCDDYVELAHRQKVKNRFFDGGKLFARNWDIFYLYPPKDIHLEAILLFPAPQVMHFLWEINRCFGMRLRLPSHDDDPAMILNNYDDGVPRPRSIATITDHQDWLWISNSIPLFTYEPVGRPVDMKIPTDEAMIAFRHQMTNMTNEEKKRKLDAKKKRAVARHRRQQNLNHELKRAQRYLGLRLSKMGKHAASTAAADASASATGLSEVEKELKKMSIKDRPQSAPRINLDEKVRYPMESNVIFICIDVEMWEKSKQLTEIGVATLDTADIANVPPGENGMNWFPYIRPRHIAITEREHMQNSQYCEGNLYGFNFGKTQWIGERDIPKVIAECFKPPYSKVERPEDIVLNYDDTSRSHEEKRNLVFVAHDARQDIQQLKLNGYDPSNLSNLVDVADTAHMYQSLTRSPNLAKLSNILLNLGLMGHNFHNAGNDAVYTMHAMIGIAIKSMADKEAVREKNREEMLKKMKQALQLTVETVIEGEQGWSSDDSDGGAAPPPFVSAEKLLQEQGNVATGPRNIMEKPSWWAPAPPAAKLEIKPPPPDSAAKVDQKPVTKPDPYLELEALDSQESDLADKPTPAEEQKTSSLIPTAEPFVPQDMLEASDGQQCDLANVPTQTEEPTATTMDPTTLPFVPQDMLECLDNKESPLADNSTPAEEPKAPRMNPTSLPFVPQGIMLVACDSQESHFTDDPSPAPYTDMDMDTPL